MKCDNCGTELISRECNTCGAFRYDYSAIKEDLLKRGIKNNPKSIGAIFEDIATLTTLVTVCFDDCRDLLMPVKLYDVRCGWRYEV